MVSSKTSGARWAQPRRHDPAVIRRLLAERESTGESYATLSARSGIPVGTLASWQAQARRRASTPTPFVEVIVKDEAKPADGGGFVVRVRAGAAGAVQREIIVPHGFDASELRRLLVALEEPC